MKTNKELMQELLTADEQAEILAEVAQEVKKIRGGKRAGSGRKKLSEDNVLQFQVRVSKKEKEFLSFARKNKINYDELMQG